MLEYLLLKDYPMIDMVKQKQEKPWLILQKLYVLSQKFDFVGCTAGLFTTSNESTIS